MVGKAIKASSRDDNVIQKRNPEHAPGLRQLERQTLVLFAWAGVAAWMIVDNDQRGHAFANQRSKHIREAHHHAIDLTHSGNVTAANAMTRIQPEDMYRFLLRHAQLSADNVGDVRRCSYLHAQQWFLRERASSQL